MPIQVQCQGCKRQFQAADRLAGKSAKCPNCSAVISVPANRPPQTAQATSGEQPSHGAAAGTPPSTQEAAWYVETSDGQQHGPMTQAQLERLVASGRLDAFCRLRHQTWSKWKWAEDLFPQVVRSDESASTGDAREAPVEPPPAAPSGRSTPPGGRVVACPDCGNMVSTRARQCPHCGCPAAQAASSERHALRTGEVPEVNGGLFADSRPGPEPGTPGSKRRMVLAVGSAAALLLIAVAGLGVSWWVWKTYYASGQPENEAQAPPDLPAPTGPPAVSPDEIEAAMQQAAADVAKRLDGEFRTAHAAKTLIEQTQVSADLMQALAQGNLDAIPDTLPTELSPESLTSYQSLYDSLYSECLAHLRENVSAENFTEQAVSDAARRWEEGKRSVLEGELTEVLKKHLAPSLQPR